MRKALVAFFAVTVFTGCGTPTATSEEVSAAPEAMAAQTEEITVEEVEAAPEAAPVQEAAPE